MEPILKSLGTVVLVGCFIIGIAVAGERKIECTGLFKDKKPTAGEIKTVLHRYEERLKSKEGEKANLCGADLQEAYLRNTDYWKWRKSREKPDDERVKPCATALEEAGLRYAAFHETGLETDLRYADLRNADLQYADLRNADLRWADLRSVDLRWAKLQGAELRCADLQGANLFQADFQGANLWDANLQGVYLDRANIHKADLGGVSLQDALYEPKPGELPDYWTLAHPRNRLDTLVYYYSPAGLIALRGAFKNGGMRTQERQVTYAIERTRRRLTWDRRDIAKQYPALGIPDEKDPRPWRQQLTDKIESLGSLVLVEFPSGYGMAPERLVLGLLILTVICTLFYWMTIKDASAESHSGLWMIEPEDRIRISRYPVKTWWEWLKREGPLLYTSFYFSLLSAFHLGWREFTIGLWIARLQRREYTLRTTGWVRTVSGFQSVLSLYLLALLIITYFGRPFE